MRLKCLTLAGVAVGMLAPSASGAGRITVAPGAAISVSGVPCSAGFLLLGPRGTHLLSTAGHCVTERGTSTTVAGDSAWRTGLGPEVRLGTSGPVIGHVLYATQVIDTSDFAVITLLPGVTADPTLVGGGRVSSLGTSVEPGQQVELSGQGLAVSAVQPKRTGLVTGTTSAHAFTVTLLAVSGDSGGPVVSKSGAALGLLIRGGGFVAPDLGTAQVIRLAGMLRRVRSQLGLSLRLQTA